MTEAPSLVGLTPRAIPAIEEWIAAIDRCRIPSYRTIEQWAEEEIVIPDGKWKGFGYRASRFPWNGLWFAELQSGRWNRFAAVGPVQSGKSFICYLIPLGYHLFERNENVIGGVPKLDTAARKWRGDIEPMIQRSGYRKYLPKSGAGARGGMADHIKFAHGPELLWMTGGGGDEQRSSATSRIVAITETDKMDEVGANSREADKITQLEARTQSYGGATGDALIYMECTVSIEKGRIWQEYINGSKSEIYKPCPHCHEYVIIERENLVGWQAAQNSLEAESLSKWQCPKCEHEITEEERIIMLRKSVLVHKGQSIDKDGFVHGDYPPTRTLGFRWNCFDNPLVNAADVGVAEWKARRSTDPDTAEKELRQFWWAIPAEDKVEEEVNLEVNVLTNRQRPYLRGYVPSQTQVLTVGIDVRSTQIHTVVGAFWGEFTGHIVHYEIEEVPSGSTMTLEAALRTALRRVRESLLQGFPVVDDKGEILRKIRPSDIFIDSGWKGNEAIYEVVRESAPLKSEGVRLWAIKGQGGDQRDYDKKYHAPKTVGGSVKHIGDHYHIVALQASRVYLVEIDVDHWKTFSHLRFSSTLEESGSVSLFQQEAYRHQQFIRQIVAEKRVTEFVPGKGEVTRWKREHRENHFGDAWAYCCVAAHLAGMRHVRRAPTPPPAKKTADPPKGIRSPDGRAYLVTQRS